MSDTSLASRIALLGQGACDCNTKSPDVHMHLPACRYRRAMELADQVEPMMDDLIAYLEGQAPETSSGGYRNGQLRKRLADLALAK